MDLSPLAEPEPGRAVSAALDSLQVDRLFLGVDGIDLQRGITTHLEAEAALNRKMARVAREVVAVTDGSKFGRTCLHRIMGIEDVNVLVTDASAPEESLEQARKLGCAPLRGINHTHMVALHSICCHSSVMLSGRKGRGNRDQRRSSLCCSRQFPRSVSHGDIIPGSRLLLRQARPPRRDLA